MKYKNMWSLLLLFSFSFSIAHEYVYIAFDKDHCSTQEYVSELSASNEHGDVCDIHYEYHALYLASEPFYTLPFFKNFKSIFIYHKSFRSRGEFESFRPPIA